MSDEPIRLDEHRQSTPAGIWEHYCEHPGCKRWGAYGYQVGRQTPAHWFCLEHRDEGERLIGRAL